MMERFLRARGLAWTIGIFASTAGGAPGCQSDGAVGDPATRSSGTTLSEAETSSSTRGGETGREADLEPMGGQGGAVPECGGCLRWVVKAFDDHTHRLPLYAAFEELEADQLFDLSSTRMTVRLWIEHTDPYSFGSNTLELIGAPYEAHLSLYAVNDHNEETTTVPGVSRDFRVNDLFHDSSEISIDFQERDEESAEWFDWEPRFEQNVLDPEFDPSQVLVVGLSLPSAEEELTLHIDSVTFEGGPLRDLHFDSAEESARFVGGDVSWEP